MQNFWYKNAIAYSLDVETFVDSNGDGIGDFQGLTQRLEYLSGLGITCLWLLPFYPSPNRDNVAAQQRDRDSLINWMERAIRIRKQCPELGCGKWQIVETDEPSVFAHCCEWEGKTVIALHNLADKACTVTLKSNEYSHLIDVFGDRQYESLNDNFHSIPLEAYGYRWFRVNQMF